jgi:mannosyltransferase OCH1-like enzyme
MIPKIIHYCWLSNDPIPADLQNYMKSWSEKLPDYKFVKWDFSIFDKESSIWVKESFERKKYAFACDYIRIYAVYNYGGIYMDMDMEVLKSFNDLLNNSTMFAYERSDHTWIEAGCFGAEKHNYFLEKCLEYYEDKHFIREDNSLEILPLPRVMDAVIRKNNLSIKAYPWTYFTAKSYDTGIESPDSTTYTIHHFAGSWKSDEEQKIYTRAKKLRTVPFGGNAVAFIYEKLAKSVYVIRSEGVSELISRIKTFVKK